MTALPAHVGIRDVSLRDGLQIEDPIPLSAKLEMLAAIAATGVKEMEATAFVSPSKVPALADAADLAAELHNFPDIEFSALVASPSRAKRAIAAGLRSIEYVVSAADGHSRSNVGRSTAEATAQIPEIVAIAHDSGVSVEVIVATAWDCPSTARHRRGVCSISWRQPATTASTVWRSPIPSAPPHRGGSAIWSRSSDRGSATSRWGTLPQHPWRRSGQRLCGGRGGYHPARRLGRRARRLSVRTWRQRQHRDGGPGLPVTRQRN